MNIHNFQGDLTAISAANEALLVRVLHTCPGLSTEVCITLSEALEPNGEPSVNVGPGERTRVDDRWGRGTGVLMPDCMRAPAPI